VDVFSSIIASLALLVSIGSLVYTIKSHCSHSRLTDREVELVRIQIDEAYRAKRAEAAAQITARLYKQARSDWRLKVVNQGPAEARNVRLLLNEQNEMVQEGVVQRAFPMEKMEKGQSVDVTALVGFNMKLKEQLTIVWDDNSGRERSNTVELTA
jgi:hypothetical protein